MMVNSDRSLSDLNQEFQSIFGEFFNKRMLKNLSKSIQNSGQIEIEIVKGNRIGSSDAVFIKEITTDFADSLNEEFDIDYKIIVGDVIPGVIKQNITIRNGRLVDKHGTCSGPLISRSNCLIYKKKFIKKKNIVTYSSTVYALVQ